MSHERFELELFSVFGWPHSRLIYAPRRRSATSMGTPSEIGGRYESGTESDLNNDLLIFRNVRGEPTKQRHGPLPVPSAVFPRSKN